MSQPLPDISVPSAASRFPGFVSWFATLRASINVAMLEVRNQSVAKAEAVASASLVTSKSYTDGAVSTTKEYTDAKVFEAINVSGLALDTDGTPYFAPGSLYPRVLVDTDGIPYFREL